MLSLTFIMKCGKNSHTFPLQPKRTVRINQNIHLKEIEGDWSVIIYAIKRYNAEGKNTSQ